MVDGKPGGRRLGGRQSFTIMSGSSKTANGKFAQRCARQSQIKNQKV